VSCRQSGKAGDIVDALDACSRALARVAVSGLTGVNVTVAGHQSVATVS
jgi:hypothetical protein